MIDLGQIASNLQTTDGDVWFARTAAPISYPGEGNDLCYELEERSFWFRHRNQCIVEAVRAFPPAGPLFDVGGGNGFLSRALQDAHLESVLVEPGPVGIRNARRRRLRPLVCATLQDAGFRANSLPAVGLFDVLEHVADDQGFLHEVQRLLIPSGMLYLTAPAYGWLWSDEDRLAGHYRRYTLRGLIARLQLCGFEVRFSSYLFSFLPLPIFLRRTLAGMLRARSAIDLERTRKEHEVSRGWAARLLERLLRFERNRLARRRGLPFGSSCFLVAQSGDKG